MGSSPRLSLRQERGEEPTVSVTPFVYTVLLALAVPPPLQGTGGIAGLRMRRYPRRPAVVG